MEGIKPGVSTRISITSPASKSLTDVSIPEISTPPFIVIDESVLASVRISTALPEFLITEYRYIYGLKFGFKPVAAPSTVNPVNLDFSLLSVASELVLPFELVEQPVTTAINKQKKLA